MTPEEIELFRTPYTLPDELRRACRHLHHTLTGIYLMRFSPSTSYTGFGAGNQKLLQEIRVYRFERTKTEWRKRHETLVELLAPILAAQRLSGQPDPRHKDSLTFAGDILAAIRKEPNVHFSRQFDQFTFKRGFPENYPVKIRTIS